MRILIVLLSVGFAGTERHALELANALSQQHSVAVLLRERPRETHRQPPYEALLAAIDPSVTVYRASRAMPAFGLWHALLRFRPDIIHAHHERSARIASRFALSVPVVATVHVHFRARDFMRCSGLIFLTRAERAAAPEAYRRPCFVIGNWVRPAPRPAPARLAALRSALGITAEHRVVGSVARLEPVKGLAGLIEAFAAARLPQGRLILCGDGAQRPALQSLCRTLGIADQVIFTGFRPDIRDLYFLFDLFVLNSSDEPYGLAILEAAAADVPVIATATIGASAIAESLPIRLVPVGDTQALAAAMQDALAASPQPPPKLPTSFAVESRVAAIVDAYRCVLEQGAASAQPEPRADLPQQDQTIA